MKSQDISLIIGAGEIGRGLHDVFQKYKIQSYLRDVEEVKVPKVHVLHIAFPYTENFVEYVKQYIEQYDPILTIIYSTLPIGTTEKISLDVVHSPVEGRHPKLARSIEKMPRWFGCANEAYLDLATTFWFRINRNTRIVGSSKFTEALKIRSTAKFGINLVWTDYEKSIADDVGMEYEAFKQFDKDYNDLYDELNYPEYKRYILDPPNGYIGGHCVVPNAELLDKQYPHPMLKMIKKMKGEK